MTLPGVTLSDAQGGKRIRMLQDRVRHIDEQIAELEDKKGIMQNEIRELEVMDEITRLHGRL